MRGKLSMLLALDGTLVLLIYVAGWMSLPLIFLLGNISMMVAIVLWEGEKRAQEVAVDESLSNDERWEKIKVALDGIDKRLSGKVRAEEREDLLKRKGWLLTEKRRLEWTLKDAELTSVEAAAKGALTPLDKAGSAFGADSPEEGAEEENDLKKVVGAAEEILAREPSESLEFALRPLLNELTAHYNAIRRKDSSSPYLADYWAAWGVLKSAETGLEIGPVIARASKKMQPRLGRLMKLADKRRPGPADGRRTHNVLAD